MTIDRRCLLRDGLMLGIALGGPGAVWARVARGDIGGATARQRTLLKAVADLVIPRTATASASQVGVPAFVEIALEHALDGSVEASAPAGIQGTAETGPRARGGIWLLGATEQLLDRQAGGDFAAALPALQHDALAAVDAAAFAPGGEHSPWHKIKDLIVIGYYTSEVGGSKELRYELVPGRWDPDLPLPVDNRSWSSDWAARDFG